MIRSKDHSIWFKHIVDPQGDLVRELRQFQPAQAVVLRIGGLEGRWRRFNQRSDGRVPDALGWADERAEAIWKSLPVEGDPVELSLVRVEPAEASVPKTVKRRGKRQGRRKKQDKKLELTPASGPLDGDVLCIGIDVAWWGGQAGAQNKHTRSECLVIATRVNGKWSDLEIRRIDLTEKDMPEADEHTANADPQAELLLDAIQKELARFATIPHVILAADVPLKALPREKLDLPNKKKERSTDKNKRVADYRACDREWHKQRKAGPAAWRNIQILPGAPLYPRVVELVSGLRRLEFSLYEHPRETHPKYTALECFPNEVLWSAGVLGHTDKLSGASIRAYKWLGKGNVRLPRDTFLGLCRHTLFPALKAASLDPATCEGWLSSFSTRLEEDQVLTDDPAEGRCGKKFDDCMDSVLSLVAAVAFALGKAHVHQGNDPEDGHIVGPGLPTPDPPPTVTGRPNPV